MMRWISRQRQMLVLQGVVVGSLQLIEQVSGGSRRRDPRPHRHRIDQQPHHRIRAGHLSRPTRDRGAKNHIMLTGQPHQQPRESALQHHVDSGVTRAGQLPQPPRDPLGHPKRSHTPAPQPQPIRRAHQCGSVKTGQHLTPRRARRIAIPTSQPSNKTAIRRGRRQPLPVIASKHLPQQNRQRPTIHHNVMISQHKPMPIICGTDQRRPKRRPISQITHRGTFSGTHLLQPLIKVQLAAAKVDIPPPRSRISRNNLHRLVELHRETSRQVRMTPDHRVHRITQPVSIQPTSHRHNQLHRIHIITSPPRTSMKKQPLLQRRQRPNVSDPHTAAEACRSAAG